LIRRIVSLCLAASLGAVQPSIGVQSQAHPAWTLDSVLHELDREAKNFESLTANIERTKVTVVVNVKSTEAGLISVSGDKMLLELKSPDPRTILRTGDALYVYNPGLKRVEEYNLGKHRELVDEFLLLGFGTSGKELKKGFLVTLLGEPLIDSQKTVLLELTPKSAQVRNQISKIHLWLDQSSWLPVQQKFYETGTNDYFIIRYSNIVRNAEIPNSRFRPRWPKGTQKIRPEG
jgi:outer membrane lipoprotein-sorting protein